MTKLNSAPSYGMAFAIVCATAVAMSGCANGPCRQIRQPDLAAQQKSGVREGTESGASLAEPPPMQNNVQSAIARDTAGSSGGKVAPLKKESVFVYKADGSLQCSTAKGLTADEMEKSDLAGIKVLSRDKRADGKMHVQVCGSPTGMINVYEIPMSSLKEAEAKGFRKL